MADEFDFVSNDCNSWNYNEFINTPNADPYNKKRVINISSDNRYNLMKYNAVIILKEILKHTSKYLNDDVKEWIYKKALQGLGFKNDYWEILSITTNLFYYYLFRTDKTINYKQFWLWFRQNPLYIKSNDETIKICILPSNPYKNCSYKEYLSNLTHKKLYDKVREIEDHETKYKFIIICDFLKDKVICGTAVYKLC
jgi:hypothetical protein